MIFRYKFTVDLLDSMEEELAKIPFDTQSMLLDVGSVTFDTNQVVLMPEEETMVFSNDFYMPEFTMTKSTQSQQIYTDPNTKQQFSFLRAEFMVTRRWTVFLFKVIIPIYFLILVSSFIFV